MTDTSSARRGRPRSFDRDLVLRRAMEAFWTHGYEGTSMTQLVDTMGIGSPSIYAAFGSKEELFREAVTLYVDTEADPAWSILEETSNTQAAIQELLLASVESFFMVQPPRGCLIILGVGHMDGADEKVRFFLRDLRRQFRDRIAGRLRRGIKEGDLSPESEPEILAECILAFFGGIAIAAVDGASETALQQSTALFCKHLLSS